MKRLSTILLLLGMSAFVFGQTYLMEDFSGGQMPPNGWSIDTQPAQWSVVSSNNAGGTAPEANFHWTNGTATSRLISPEIDLTGISSVTFSFAHNLNDYNHTDYYLGAATTSGGSGVWTDVWTLVPTGSIPGQTVSLTIDNADVGQADFQICIYFSGNMYNLNDWYIDDVMLFTPYDLNAILLSINTSPFVGEPVAVTGQMKNFGLTQINSFNIDWEVDGIVHSTLIDGLSLDFGDTYDYTCDDLFDFPIGTYDLKVTITSVNGELDEDPSNNEITKMISVISHTVLNRPCLEEFTSSTCSPCAGFNAQFSPWCDDHIDDITLIKYQMNWPGSGDPYYTEEGGVRRNYYGVSGVPTLFTDGSMTGAPGYVPTMANVNEAYDEAIVDLGLISMVASHSLEGTTMDISTTILPYAGFSDAVVYIVVFEYITTQNVGGNGETSFEHVMMKMVPDANGTDVNLVDRVPYTINETVDLSGTNVEEWDDLGVAVFVQDMTTKKVYQSNYSLEDMAYATEGRLSAIYIDGEALEGFDPDVMDYNIELPSGTVEMPVITAELMDANGIKVIVPANEFPGTATVDSYGEDLATHYTYNVNLSVLTGIGNETFDAVQVYPNPTNGKLYLRGTTNTTITVYSAIGTEVASYEDFTGNTIDLSNLENGIYFINIVLEDKTVVNKKINLFR